MSRLYISADLEGVCGVVSPHHCNPEPDRALYEQAIRQMHREVEVVAETVLAAGISEVVVNDSHCSMVNLDWAKLPSNVSLVSGKPKRCAMTAGLDSGFAAAIFIGYHARAGAHKGVLSHTFHAKVFDVSINGVSYGEGGINALHASLEYDVPLILASGDRAFIDEIHTLIPGLATVETKVGLGQSAALCHPWERVREDYQAKTRQALASLDDPERKRLTLPGPYELRLTFINPLLADAADLIPGPERVDGRTFIYRANCFHTVYRMMQACYTMLAAVSHLE